MTTQQCAEFGKMRAMFWPIHRSELRKFLPMLFIYSLIVLNYSILKPAKEALLVTAPEAGAETLPFIKVWAILPMAFLSTLIFTRLSNRFSREKVFYIMMGAFLSFFFLFAFVLYPNQDSLHPHALANKLQAFLPSGFKGFIAIFRNWTFTLFYVMSELWGTIIMTVLFWSYVNETCTVKNAKRFYAILGLGANLATILAGQISILCSGNYLRTKMFFTDDPWSGSLMVVTTIIIITGLITLVLYWRLTRNLKREEKKFDDEAEVPRVKEAAIKMGIRKNFSYLFKSKYLLCIAVIVLIYNLSLNLVEVVWKQQVHHLCPLPNDYNAYMGHVMTYIGITSTIISVFICGQVIRRFGWTISAYLTPLILLATGIFFFSFLLFKDIPVVASLSALLGYSPLVLAAFFGSMQNCFSRASKFTFFDVTKEISFIPLSSESKLKGKAAIDGVGSRLGKSGGSVIHQCLLFTCGSLSMSTPYIAAILLIVFVAWMLAVRSLGQQFTALTESSEEITISDEPAEQANTPLFVPSEATPATSIR